MNVAFATAWFTCTTDHQQAEPPNPGLHATRFAPLTALGVTGCDDPESDYSASPSMVVLPNSGPMKHSFRPSASSDIRIFEPDIPLHTISGRV